MLDPNMLNYLGKLRQKELIERGQPSASARDFVSRAQRRSVTLLLLRFRARSLSINVLPVNDVNKRESYRA